MKITKTLYAKNRKEWRSWLKKHHKIEKEVWLIYYRKNSGKARVPYGDAVEEALCYGWIDSIVKKIDEARFVQRFSPRKNTSNLSQPNIERVRKLIAQRKMTKAGLKAIAHAFDPSRDHDTVRISPYILKALKADAAAWEHFQKLPDGYKRVRIAYIEVQGRHGKQQGEKALHHFVYMTAKNKKFGFLK